MDKDQIFDVAFEKLCELEGFKSDVAGDPGGRTIWGISERYFPEDVNKMLSLASKEAKEYAKQFYKTKFWNPVAHLPTPINVVAFLMGVNAPGPVKRLTVSYNDHRDVLLGMCEYYSAIVGKNPNLSKFFRGWINRVVEVWHFAREITT